MSEPRRILVLDGHPSDRSLCRALGEAYERGARSSGAEVRRTVVAHLVFDPVLRGGYGGEQPLEPDLVRAQEDIAWADHLVFVHPVWWSDLPALLKGFVDRVFLPGFAFKYRTSGLWDKLLRGKSARIVHTQDAPSWYYRFFVGRPSVRALRDGVLGFCGVAPVRLSAFGGVRRSSAARRAAWLARVEELGRDRS
jgi:putative NADPH-quinone reductase